MKFDSLYWRIIPLTLCFGGFINICWSQSKTAIKIVIVDQLNSPIEFASAMLRDTKTDSTITFLSDKSGKLAIPVIPLKSYLVTVQYIGFEKFVSQTLYISNSSGLDLDTIVLKSKTTNLKEVAVTVRKPLVTRKIDRFVIDVENNIFAAGTNFLDLLTMSPGITMDMKDNIRVQGKKGVAIYINNQPTNLSGQQLSQYLSGLSSDNIKSFEIITNPPASYDAAGTGAILNIILKKPKADGLAHRINSSVTQGDKLETNLGYNLDVKTKKLTSYLNVNYANPRRYDLGVLQRKYNVVQGTTLFDELSSANSKRNNYKFFAGTEYAVNKNNILSISFDGLVSNNTNTYGAITTVDNLFNKPDSIFTTNNNTKSNSSRFGGNFKYNLKELRGKVDLLFNYDYLHYNSNRDLLNQTSFFAKNAMPDDQIAYLTQNPLQIDISIFSLDYKKKIDTTQSIEMGLRSSFVKNHNSSSFYEFDTGKYLLDADLSDDFKYNENIYSIYTTWEKKWKAFSLKLGLRYEQTVANSLSVNSGTDLNRNFGKLFPTLYFQKQFKENQFFFSYGRRILRPNYQSLNPFRFYYGPYNYSVGNPYLRPELTHQFEIGAILGDIISISASYSRTNDVMQSEYTTQDDSTKISTSSTINLKKYNRVYLGFTTDQKLTSWYNVSASLDSYVDVYYPDLINDKVKRVQSALDFYLTHSFKFNSFTLQIQNSYSSPFIDAQTRYRPSGYVNAALRKTFFKKVASLNLRVTDIFKTQLSRGLVDFQNQHFNSRSERDSRRVTLALQINLIKGSKITKDNSSKSEDVKQRIGN